MRSMIFTVFALVTVACGGAISLPDAALDATGDEPAYMAPDVQTSPPDAGSDSEPDAAEVNPRPPCHHTPACSICIDWERYVTCDDGGFVIRWCADAGDPTLCDGPLCKCEP